MSKSVLTYWLFVLGRIMVSFRFDDKNEAVKYDLTNACHEHNIHMPVVAGIYVIHL